MAWVGRCEPDWRSGGRLREVGGRLEKGAPGRGAVHGCMVGHGGTGLGALMEW